MRFLLILAICTATLAGCSTDEPPAKEQPAPQYTFRIVNDYPHDTSAFTQGLLFHGGYLYEGTGQHGQSELRQIDLETGEILQRRKLNDSLFGEGIALLDDKLYQLTWLSQRALVWDLTTFDSLGAFRLPTQGWGLTTDGQSLIVSDGTANLYYRDPVTFEQTKMLEVRDHIGAVVALNELEWIDGEIWANVWRWNFLIRISPESGKVIGWVRLSGLIPATEGTHEDGVLNGIAYDSTGNRLFVTGKNWPHLYEIEVIPLNP